jgi:hypothetical protein
MDPQSTNQGNFEVPAQYIDTTMIPLIPGAEAHPAASETSPVPTAATAQPITSQPATDPAAISAIFQQSSAVPAPTSSSTTTPSVADDLDLIEKEWVDKAKAIVSSTKSDPFSQNKEMNRFKADYMQKRYGKEIKLDEK